jgi:cytochrome oxidase assembly protein ShyY1
MHINKIFLYAFLGTGSAICGFTGLNQVYRGGSKYQLMSQRNKSLTQQPLEVNASPFPWVTLGASENEWLYRVISMKGKFDTSKEMQL